MVMMKMHVSKGMVLRIAADILLVNAAFLLAIVLRILALGVFSSEMFNQSDSDSAASIAGAIEIFAKFAIPLTVISIAIFSLSGFYTHGRTYCSRFKALLILQSVTLSYLLLAFLSYMFYTADMFSRAIWVFGWVTTLIMIAGARLWSAVWKTNVSFESKFVIDPKPAAIRDVLVIGGAGYLGSVLIRKLLRRDYNVKILDRLMYGDSSILDLYSYDRRFHVVRGDFRNIDVIVKAMNRADAVVHLGAIVGDPACQIDEQMTFDINLMSTKMIAEVAKGFNVRRFIFASTCSVYGANEQILTEKSELKPQSLYARTKIASEQVLQSIGQNGFLPIILRFATLFGLSYRPRFDLVINLLSAKAVCDGEIKIFGGQQWRPFIHVHDVADAIIKFLEVPLFADSPLIYNVGANSLNYQISEIGEIIKRLRPEVRVISMADESDPRNYRVSFNLIENRLNFKPEHTIESGVREVMDVFDRGLITNCTDARYNNYKFLSEDFCFKKFKFDMVPKDVLGDAEKV
jgi:nucleoside-diphosphate-sugar epimerase